VGERNIQSVYDEWSSGLDNRLCDAHKKVLDRMAKEEVEG